VQNGYHNACYLTAKYSTAEVHFTFQGYVTVSCGCLCYHCLMITARTMDNIRSVV